MWRADPDWVLVVGASELSISRGASGTAVTATLGAAATAADLRAALETLAIGLDMAAAPTRRGRLRVLVSDRWLAITTLTWSDGQLSSVTMQDQARLRFVDAGVALEPGTTVCVDEDVPRGRPRMAVAYGAELMLALNGFAAALGAVLVSAQPLSVVAACHARREPGRPTRVVVLEDDQARLVHWSLGAPLVSAAARESAFLDDRPGAFRAYWRRQVLRQPGLADSEPVAVVDLDTPGLTADSLPECTLIAFPTSGAPKSVSLAYAELGSSAIDAVEGNRRNTARVWSVALLAVAIALALALDAGRLAQAVAEGERGHQNASARVAVVPPQPWSRVELEQIKSVNAAVRELNLPMAQVIKAVLPPRDIPVRLLGLELARSVAEAGEDGSVIKLALEAGELVDMTRYVGFLSDGRGLAEVYLVRHETLGGRGLIRFNVEAQWLD